MLQSRIAIVTNWIYGLMQLVMNTYILRDR